LHYLSRFKLIDIQVFDQIKKDCEPENPKWINQLESLIGNTIERVRLLEGNQNLIERGDTLRRRLHSVGSCPEPVVLILARKA
jgi:hypothetical protein